jgi:predicted nuclease of restriction endonuclease-like RecB superfamily
MGYCAAVITSAHSIVQYEAGRAMPDRLTRVTHRHYLAYAQRMLTVYATGIARTRRDLHRGVRNVVAEEPDCGTRRIGAFCKLLDDAGEFDTDRRGAAAALRLRVFDLAAKYHPLVTEPDQMFERSERETKQNIATELGRPWEEVERQLYVDVIDHQPLVKFENPPTPEQLLSRYNLAQLQACLYKSQRMTVIVSADFSAIIRYAKLARLLLNVRQITSGQYRIDLTGPASVLHETRRYGIGFARFVGALVSCRGWELRANVMTPWGASAELRVNAEDGYRSHVPAPDLFDSQVEHQFFEDWGSAREGWKLLRDAGILQHGQTTFVPDFRLVHEDGRAVYLEIVGFWTPEYLAAKRQTLVVFKGHRILLAVPKRTAKENAEAIGAIVYGTRLKPEAVVAALSGV